MTEGGVITGECQVFTDIFMLVGKMISGIIGGEGNRGNITGYITMIFITIGVTGKEQGTGTREDLVGAVETVGMEIVVGTVVVAVPVVVEALPAVVEAIPVVVVAVQVVVEAVPVVVELVSVEENPVYNLVPIIRKMIRRTGQKITRQNVKQPHNKIITVEKPCQL